jgi:hypothetical protein
MSLLTQLYDLGGHGVATPTYQSEDSPEIKMSGHSPRLESTLEDVWA